MTKKKVCHIEYIYITSPFESHSKCPKQTIVLYSTIMLNKLTNRETFGKIIWQLEIIHTEVVPGFFYI